MPGSPLARLRKFRHQSMPSPAGISRMSRASESGAIPCFSGSITSPPSAHSTVRARSPAEADVVPPLSGSHSVADCGRPVDPLPATRGDSQWGDHWHMQPSTSKSRFRPSGHVRTVLFARLAIHTQALSALVFREMGCWGNPSSRAGPPKSANPFSPEGSWSRRPCRHRCSSTWDPRGQRNHYVRPL